MKTLFVMLLMSSVSVVHASGNSCKELALDEVESTFTNELDGRQLEDISCELDETDSGVFNICSIYAGGTEDDNGNYVGSIQFTVYLNKDCTKVLSSEITGEE